jgi:hypothetical protein
VLLMSVYDNTSERVRACRWSENGQDWLCPLHNDCCEVCMHPDAPRDAEGHRLVCGDWDEAPTECPLREGNCTVELVE